MSFCGRTIWPFFLPTVELDPETTVVDGVKDFCLQDTAPIFCIPIV